MRDAKDREPFTNPQKALNLFFVKLIYFSMIWNLIHWQLLWFMLALWRSVLRWCWIDNSIPLDGKSQSMEASRKILVHYTMKTRGNDKNFVFILSWTTKVDVERTSKLISWKHTRAMTFAMSKKISSFIKNHDSFAYSYF